MATMTPATPPNATSHKKTVEAAGTPKRGVQVPGVTHFLDRDHVLVLPSWTVTIGSILNTFVFAVLLVGPSIAYSKQSAAPGEVQLTER